MIAAWGNGGAFRSGICGLREHWRTALHCEQCMGNRAIRCMSEQRARRSLSKGFNGGPCPRRQRFIDFGLAAVNTTATIYPSWWFVGTVPKVMAVTPN